MQDEIAKVLVHELGIAGLSAEAQEETLNVLGEGILERVMIEIVRILPESKHEEFRALIGTASPLRIHTYLEPYVTDLPAFVERYAKEEVARFKELLAEA